MCGQLGPIYELTSRRTHTRSWNYEEEELKVVRLDGLPVVCFGPLGGIFQQLRNLFVESFIELGSHIIVFQSAFHLGFDDQIRHIEFSFSCRLLIHLDCPFAVSLWWSFIVDKIVDR